MLQIKSIICYSSLLILKVFFNYNSDICHKHAGFFKILQKKNINIVSNRKNGTFAFHSSLELPLAEVDPILEKKARKKTR